MISGSQFQSCRNTIHFKTLIYSRNLKAKNLFQVNLSEIWISALSTFWAYKTVVVFKVSTVGKIIWPGFTDYRAVLSYLSPTRPKNRRHRQNFCIRVLTVNSDPLLTIWSICQRFRTLESLKSAVTCLNQLNSSFFIHYVHSYSLNWPKKVVSEPTETRHNLEYLSQNDYFLSIRTINLDERL